MGVSGAIQYHLSKRTYLYDQAIYRRIVYPRGRDHGPTRLNELIPGWSERGGLLKGPSYPPF
ncbi:protein of unknown function [Paraburkholderia kururiensis]